MTAPVLRPHSGPARLLLRLWAGQGQGVRLVSTIPGRDSARLAELGYIQCTVDGFTTLTQEGRQAAKVLEGSS